MNKRKKNVILDNERPLLKIVELPLKLFILPALQDGSEVRRRKTAALLHF